jgi:3-oxoadipate enol-lactonase
VEHLADPTMGRMLTEAFAAKQPARWRALRSTIVGTSALGYIGCGHATLNFDFTAQLPALAMPVLVVYGADDPLTPPAENRRIADLVPNGRHEQIADARHMPNVEHPDAFNRIMIDWLRRRA